MTRAPISAMVLTFNEELNIERTLESIAGWVSEIVIVDSYSSDATLEICRRYTSRVFQHRFENQARQCNWALESIDWKEAWILRLDADEVVPLKLQRELTAIVSAQGDVSGVYMNRRMYFMNRWLKHGGIHPHYILRLFRRGHGQFEDKTEEHFVLTSGRAVCARQPFLEDNRQNTLKFWLRKHDDLSDGEIHDTLLETLDERRDIKARLFGNKAQRMRWLKVHIYARLPLFVRPVIYFVYRYILRLGFLDGLPGLVFHVLQAFWYRFYVDARIYERRSSWQTSKTDYRHL